MDIFKERKVIFSVTGILTKLVVPLIIEQLLAILVGMADSIMVSKCR